jgi:hypothetical protein
LLKHVRNWSYEVVEREVRANPTAGLFGVCWPNPQMAVVRKNHFCARK